MECRFCGQELHVVSNEGDPSVRPKDRMSYWVDFNESPTCRLNARQNTVHVPKEMPGDD
jgi:hypothetical protein